MSFPFRPSRVAATLALSVGLCLAAGPVRADLLPNRLTDAQRRLTAMQKQVDAWQDVLTAQDDSQPKVRAARRQLDAVQQQLANAQRLVNGPNGRNAARLQANGSQGRGCQRRTGSSTRQMRAVQRQMAALQAKMKTIERQMKAFLPGDPSTQERTLRAGAP